MNKSISAILLVMALLALPLVSEAGNTRVFVGLNVGVGHVWGPGYWGGHPYWHPRPYWGYRPYWRAPLYYAVPPVILQQPAVVVPAPPAQQYWYYCWNPAGYYPYVTHCPGGWQAVPPQPAR